MLDGSPDPLRQRAIFEGEGAVHCKVYGSSSMCAAAFLSNYFHHLFLTSFVQVPTIISNKPGTGSSRVEGRLSVVLTV